MIQRASNSCKQSIKRWEGCELTAYCNYPGEPWTIGHGSTRGVVEGMTITLAEADERFERDVRIFETSVAQLNAGRVADGLAELEQQHFDALVHFAFNVRNFESTSPFTQARTVSNPDSAAIASRFCEYTLVSGTRAKGIVNRRVAEYRMYVLGEY